MDTRGDASSGQGPDRRYDVKAYRESLAELLARLRLELLLLSLAEETGAVVLRRFELEGDLALMERWWRMTPAQAVADARRLERQQSITARRFAEAAAAERLGVDSGKASSDALAAIRNDMRHETRTRRRSGGDVAVLVPRRTCARARGSRRAGVRRRPRAAASADDGPGEPGERVARRAACSRDGAR